MLAALEPMQQVPNSPPYPWTPARPSPLSPRRASSSPTATFATSTTPIHQPQFQSPTSIFTFSPTPSPSQNKTEPTAISSRSRSPNTNANATTPSTSPTPNYATRYTTKISNPLLDHSTKRAYTSSTSSHARSVRRNAFLNRVKQHRESGRFEARAEQLAYLEDIAEHKEWVEGMKRRADEIQSRFGLGIEEEQEGEGEGYLDADAADEAEMQALDEYLEQEHAVEMELFDRMESAAAAAHLSNKNEHRQGDATSSFSDEEYDDIFMDIMDHGPPEDMDMSG